ncbi:C-type lectin galactose-binding isoform [Electrophorus electricus]|uniref:C-type lectin galactose-binding isoform n=1 Tax=Electrophorus electricus TaxID=8005 RepID=UPI0015D03CFB|nr:C-type lectin galactose-binding isoform [Electrophorus electricus]
MPSLATYGGPAISINEKPDSNGCLVIPANIDIGNQAMSWQQSCEYCIRKGSNLISPSSSVYQSLMAKMLTDVKAQGQAWIGLRRSLITMAWYWQSEDDFGFTDWDKDQPDIPEKGMCASMLMTPGSDYTWSSDPCCSTKLPVCYMPAQYMSIINPYA